MTDDDELIFTVTIEVNIDLSVNDVWNGDPHPPSPTADDVAAAMEGWMNERRRGLKRLLEEWALLDEDYMTVTVSGPGFDGEPTCAAVVAP